MESNKIGYFDKCCLNCEYWSVNYQMNGPAEGTICTRGEGATPPDYVCSKFLATNEDFDMYYCGQTRHEKLSNYLDYLD